MRFKKPQQTARDRRDLQMFFEVHEVGPVFSEKHDLPQSCRDGDGPTPYDASERQWV